MSEAFAPYPPTVMALLHTDSLSHVSLRPTTLAGIFVQNKPIGRREPIEQRQVLHTRRLGHRPVEELHAVDVDEFEGGG